MKSNKQASDPKPRFIEGIDYYFENGLLVMTAEYLSKRGYCCGNGCRHCPFDKKDDADHKRKVSNSSRTSL